MWRDMTKALRLITILALVGFGVSACGVKGALEAPPGTKKAEPAHGPDGKKPHKPFVLDGVIR